MFHNNVLENSLRFYVFMIVAQLIFLSKPTFWIIFPIIFGCNLLFNAILVSKQIFAHKIHVIEKGDR